MKKLFLLVTGFSFAFSIEYVVPPKGQSLPGFNLEWTNQGNPKQMILEEYYVSQKFGLDEKSLRRREISRGSSSGFEAGIEMRTSSTGSTMPRPRKCAHSRFAMLRANHGFSGAVIHFASATRRSPSGVVSGISVPSG